MAIMSPEERALSAFADAEIAVVDEELVHFLVNCYVAAAMGDMATSHTNVNLAQDFLFANLEPHQIARSIFVKLWPRVIEKAEPMLAQLEELNRDSG
jgi:hypothetical protein